MSDLFVGELLVLFLLFPALFRPFFQPLQRLSGIAALPLAALLLSCAALLGDRFRLSFAPTLVFTVLAFLVTLPRFYRLCAGLASDWFGAGTKALYVLMIGLYACTLWATAAFAPELAWTPSSGLLETRSIVELNGGRGARLHSLESAEKGSVGTVLFVGPHSLGARSTAAQTLAEAGYRVTEAEFSPRSGLRGPAFGFSPAQARILITRVLSRRFGVLSEGGSPAEDAAAARDIVSLARKLRAESGSSLPVFVLAEGYAVDATREIFREDDALFTGVLYLVDENGTESVAGAARLAGASGFMSAGAEAAPVMVFSGNPSDLYGFGELGADDPLAAALAFGARDKGRKLAELTARRILAWFEMRRTYDDSGT